MGRKKLDNPKETPPVAITIRSTREWLEWLDSLREEHGGIPRTALIDLALRQLAERSKHPKPPKRY